jgi:23S rRNA pseudouridine2605 synthase
MENKETHRVQKLISSYGYCSRRKAEDLIQAGRVKVNGKTIKIGEQATEQDKITIDGKEIKGSEKIYIAFNKPIGCVTALEDKHQKTIMEYIDLPTRVIPIGRLDYNTSGLLILTNDGDYANLVMHPRYEVKKTYLAGTKEPLSDFDKKKIENGIVLEDGKTSPAKVKLGPKNTAEITIHEGKNRIIRRMLEALGHRVFFLERIKIGSLWLGDLEPGAYRHLSKADREKVFK